jgi:hypothetical protein
VELYGRGGRAAAAEGDELESEWRGGDDPNTFAARRPGWSRPIHAILADAGVRAFVHGHDHRFVFEPPLDGVHYVTVPHPADSAYRRGFASKPSPDSTVLPNSGHLLFEARPGELTMSYVRSYLPGDGPDGQVAFTHTWSRQLD